MESKKGKLDGWVVDEVVISSIQSYNQIFVEATLKEWDKGGEGFFADFVRRRVNKEWHDMVRRN